MKTALQIVVVNAVVVACVLGAVALSERQMRHAVTLPWSLSLPGPR